MKTRNERAAEAILRVMDLQKAAVEFSADTGNSYKGQRLAESAERFTAWLDSMRKAKEAGK